MEKTTKELIDFSLELGEYQTMLTEKFKHRPVWHKPYEGDVLAHLPGTIVAVEVKEGDYVKEGQLLLIHQAMKMLNRVAAPITGVVTHVDVKVGEQVPKNHLMVRIDPK